MKFLSTLFVLNIICQCFCSPSNEVGEKKKKTILALGGNGFIGSAVLHNLLSKGTYDPVITKLLNAVPQMLYISTSFHVLAAPESWSKHFFQWFFNLFLFNLKLFQ